MPNRFFFADEAGCFAFQRERASKYFILCTVCMDDCGVGAALQALRRDLAWKGEDLGDYFHASEDKQAVRDAVYSTILQHQFTVQATLLEKSKAYPRVCQDKPTFYKYGWYYHFKYEAPRLIRPQSEALITTASLGTKKERVAFKDAVNDVMRQTVPHSQWRTDFPPAATDPCLQVADYCAWAIQRKWERQDVRSYDLIKSRISSEYDLWQRGTLHYY